MVAKNIERVSKVSYTRGDCMRRRISEEEEGHGSSERWLLTYSDMITLLLALFIIMYSMSTIDAAKFKALAENMGAALNNPAKATSESSGGSPGTKETSEVPAPQNMEGLYNEVKGYIKDNNLEDQVEVTGTGSYVKINLKDSVLFLPNSDDMLSKSNPILSEIELLIKKYYPTVGHISIRGHTAYVPGDNTLKSQQFSWELSSNRALTVLNYFVVNGLAPDKFSIEGCSSYEPAATNDTEEGRSKNRRVEIVITK